MKEYLWHKEYPAGVPHEVESPYADLPEMIAESCQQYRDLTAFIHMGTRLSYGEIEKLSAAFGAFLQHELGLKPGERVALQLPNLLQYPIACLGIIRAGLVVVNVNPIYTVREMAYQFKDAGVSAIVILDHFADKLQEILPKTNIAFHRIVLTSAGDMFPFAKRTMVSMALRYLKRAVPTYSLPKAISFRDALSIGKKHRLVPPTLQREDQVLLQYTGGTTGASKGAVLTHGNILSNVAQMHAWIGSFFERGKESIITALPLYHSFAFTCSFLMPLTLGVQNVLVTDPRQLKTLIDTMRDYPFTFILGVNTLFAALLRQPGFRRLDFSRGKIAVAGGMALQDAVATGWKEATDFHLVEGYGLSETSPVVAVNPPDGRHRIGTVGLAVPNTELKLLDEKNKEVAQGKVGELAVRGPQVMTGYWQKDEENASVFVDGFFKTGDMGVFDADGYLRLVDRKKDMIIISGYKAYPSEIEEVLCTHPQVLEVGVVGVQDKRGGQYVKAFVVRSDEVLTIEELLAYSKEHLAQYKVPSDIVFVTELPKTNVGKILRRKLLEL